MAAALGMALLAGVASSAIERNASANPALRWPSPVYRENPVAFFGDILGAQPWEKQIEIAEAIRDHRRVAVSSGQKTGKSTVAAWIALWFFSSFEDARVVLTATTARQVDGILWRETIRAHQGAGWCLACRKLAKLAYEARQEPPAKPCAHSQIVEGRPGKLARTGLKALDLREIVGFTARESEAVSGTSSVNLLYIVDEASGVPDLVFEGIEGNRASGGRVLLLSQPTRTEGEFYEAFHAKSGLYKTIVMSSEDTPNAKKGTMVVPGLALRSYIEEKRAEWGKDSPLYKIRVLGQFVVDEDGKVFGAGLLTGAQTAWDPEERVNARLYIGIDCAGESGEGDEATFCPRRAHRVSKILARKGLAPRDYVSEVLAIILEEREGRERDEVPVVLFDAEGEIGGRVFAAFAAHLEIHPNAFELRPVRASLKAQRNPHAYDRVRDELWACGRAWMKDGGTIPTDPKLEQELHKPEWVHLDARPQLKVTPKEEIRKALGRSPDRADAFLLSVWEQATHDDTPVADTTLAAAATPSPDPVFAPMDPYEGMRVWSGT